ncbi:MAG TPA: ubiquinone/menaquinone biosynthesis methyltransferase [Gemmatimonadota bacterium]|nr:ubiquinone/menaquinone biosynthesis methyltransferase [Gemmatimonadota bacterium]
MTSAPRTPLAAESPEERARAVREMFSAIAPRYDLLNHLLSLNVDRSWRRRAVDRLVWESSPDGTYLDVCAGTYDLAIELARRQGFRGRVLAADFSRAMLRAGSGKIGDCPIVPTCADALQMPFASAAFDGALAAFGIRNLADIEAGLLEIARVLRPGARLVILDFATPARQPLKSLYRFYFTRVLPLLGRIVSKHSFAYKYLPESVLQFAEPAALGGMMSSCGLQDVGWRSLTGGIACLWWGTAR